MPNKIENNSQPKCLYECVIFDWDGTLADSQSRIVQAIQYTAQQHGFEVLSVDVTKQVIGLSLEQAILTLYPSATAKDIQDMSNSYTKYFLQKSTVKMEPFAYAEQLLQDLKSSNVKVAIATGKSRKGLNQVLSEFGFEKYFDFTRTPTESLSKPNPLMLEQILKEFNLDPSQAVMIGDSVFDMEMAHNIGMDRLALTHGVHELSQLTKYNPTATFNDLKSLRAWLFSETL